MALSILNSLLVSFALVISILFPLSSSLGFNGGFSSGFTGGPTLSVTAGSSGAGGAATGPGSSKSYIRIEGDIMFGGLFPVHSARTSRSTSPSYVSRTVQQAEPQSASLSSLQSTTARMELSSVRHIGDLNADGQVVTSIESVPAAGGKAQQNPAEKIDAEKSGLQHPNALFERVDPCGPLKDDVGIQRLEAMLCAVQYINQHAHILPAGKALIFNTKINKGWYLYEIQMHTGTYLTLHYTITLFCIHTIRVKFTILL